MNRSNGNNRLRGWHSRAIAIAVTLLLVACAKSTDPEVLFENGDFDRAFPLFKARAEQGDIIAINYLGMHYYLGEGVERDFKKAAKWFEIAALAEHPGAQRNLGMMYFQGLGVEKDNHQAYGWLYFARIGGNTGAQGYLDVLSDKVTPNAGGVARRKIQQKIDDARDAQSALKP